MLRDDIEVHDLLVRRLPVLPSRSGTSAPGRLPAVATVDPHGADHAMDPRVRSGGLGELRGDTATMSASVPARRPGPTSRSRRA
ncbi:hypothetical protein DKG34_01470 [Streptomyces sp. NWU49]|nr:hypothetical protein DKG34_01470 [Streptomyces sp. NWU49]